MRRRLPLLRTVVVLTAALIVSAVALLGFVRVSRVVVAPGRLAAEPAASPGSDGTALRFEGVIPETERARLRPGQTATIRLESYPWTRKGTLSGRVAAVGGGPSGTHGGLAVILTVDPDTAPGPLVDGLHGEARIATGETEPLGHLLLSRLADAGP